MRRSVWVAISTVLMSALTPWPALASPAVTGAWDVSATAVARYRYEGRPVRLEVPFSFTVTFNDDGTYRAADIDISCLPEGVTLPEAQGRWRLGRGGRLHATPSLIGGLRERTEACLRALARQYSPRVGASWWPARGIGSTARMAPSSVYAIGNGTNSRTCACVSS
jgi:hypothetical protein